MEYGGGVGCTFVVEMTHEFTYRNGLKQRKRLIRHSDYLAWKNLPETTEDEIELKVGAFKTITGGDEWFTDKSPYFDAIKSGTLNCNGTHICIVIDLKKEGICALQRIDCNCNDCGFLERLQNKLNEAVANDKLYQEEFFNITIERKINKTLNDIENLEKHRSLIRNADDKIKGKQNYLSLLKKKKFGYQGQKTQSQYGRCLNFDKEITFFPNTCQIETQKCFIHRKDIQ